jgi:tetratricopeptide (TPR) repeat protein
MRTAFFAVVFFLAGVGAARAEDPEQLIRDGVALRRQGREEAALEQFRRSYAITPGAHALAQIALVEQALGQWVAAERDLERALAAADDEWIARNRALLEAAQAVIRNHVGELDVVGPAHAEVVIDGEAAGTLPLAAPLRVLAGQIELEVRLAGYQRARREVEVRGHGLTREKVTLVATPPPEPAPAAKPIMSTPPVAVAARPAPPKPFTKRTGFWGLMAGGALAVAGGVALGIVLGTFRDPHPTYGTVPGN